MVLEELRSLFTDSPSESPPNIFELRESEKWWRDRYSLLESHGYRLRERLHPGWIPSWKMDPTLQPELCNDSVYNRHSKITPAIRIQDGSDVIIKRVSKSGNERTIAVFLSSEKDERNHCVPILDTFSDEEENNTEFIVMPLLRDFDSPPFYRVNEVLDFMRQTLEGIAFIHSKNVAHRDCSDLNILLDGGSMYPNGFHPIRHVIARDRRGMAKYRNRSEVEGVKYYFSDFGISTQFDSSDKYRLVTGCRCQTDVPELSDYIPYDPFAVDIYLLGDVYKRHFIQKFENVQFLEALVESMVDEDPDRRPDAAEALNTLDELIASQSGRSMRWRLIAVTSDRFSRLVVNVKCIGSEIVFALHETIGWRLGKQMARVAKS